MAPALWGGAFCVLCNEEQTWHSGEETMSKKHLIIALGGVAAAAMTAGAVLAQAPARPDPAAAAAAQAAMGYRDQSKKDGKQIETPTKEDTFLVDDNLPDSAPAKPKKPRRVFVFARALGYAHSNIPLSAYAVKSIGDHTHAYQTDISFDLKDFTAANLAKYDTIVLDNTTGKFLDDDDATATAARRKALLDFVRGGKGLVMMHAAGDSYHGSNKPRPPAGTPNTGPRENISLWPEYSKMTGGYFKFHWQLPREFTIKIDDPASPINAAFHGKPFTVHDEFYTFPQDEYNNKNNFHVLTSIDYSKMSPEDKAIEPASQHRTDGFYVTSWIRSEGKGRVFYQTLGHSEHVLGMPNMEKQLLAGIQFANGDLAADTTPTAQLAKKAPAKK
jgi:type 1 glutamine amidotransferase